MSPENVFLAYLKSVNHLLNQTDLDETRIPELVAQINSTMPSVPGAVRDELVDMVSWLTMYRPEADATPRNNMKTRRCIWGRRRTICWPGPAP